MTIWSTVSQQAFTSQASGPSNPTAVLLAAKAGRRPKECHLDVAVAASRTTHILKYLGNTTGLKVLNSGYTHI